MLPRSDSAEVFTLAAPGGKITSLSTSLVAQLQPGGTSRTQLASVPPDAWFGPSQPIAPQAPPGTGGRLYDYPFGANLQYIPRSTEPVSFADLRALADNLPLLRAVIETRKDQIAAMDWSIRPVPEGDKSRKARQPKLTDQQRGRIADVRAFLRKPDKILPFDTWLRALLEDMLVIDAATIYPRPTLGGDLFSLDVIDGATIKPMVDVDGRRPMPPDPAFQQVLKGIPAADFTQDELMYLPRNVRPNKVYGFSPVEQIILTINIALRRDTSTLEYYRSGTVPDSFGTLPKEWTPDQIKAFQTYFDSLMSGNTQARRGLRFMPSDFKFQEAQQPPLKDMYDEWLARVICYVFSVPVTPLVAQVNRATAETQHLQATQEGLIPLQRWLKHSMDHIVQELLGEKDLEFAWADGEQVDPVEEMTELTGYVQAGILNRDEARDRIGEEPIADGSGGDYTISGPALSPARLQTPEEKQAEQEHALSLIAAKKPEPGDVQPGAKPGEKAGNAGEKGDAPADDKAEKMLDVYVRVRNHEDVSREELAELSKYVEHIPGGALGLLLKYDENQPRDGHGRFASTGSPKQERASKDNRPRDENGRFVPSGGSSRAYTAAGKRRRLIEGVKNAVERVAIGAALYGGAALATAAFAPQAGAAALTIGITRAIGVAAIGDGATTAVLSVLDYLKVPESLRDSVQAAVRLGLGAYGLADVETNFEGYMESQKKQEKRVRRAEAKAQAEKMLKAADPTFAEILDAVRVVLYEYAQDAVEKMKAEVAAKAKRGDGPKLAVISEGLEDMLEDFLDHVDKIGGGGDHPDGGDKHSAKDHPVAEVAEKTSRFREWHENMQAALGQTGGRVRKAVAGEAGAPFAAGIAFTTPDDRVLLLRRAKTEDHEGEWCLPGGKVDPGENAAQAAIRESDEEAGALAAVNLTVQDIGLPISVTDVGEFGGGRQFHTFHCPIDASFEVDLDEDESSEYVWASLDDLPAPLHPGVSRTLPLLRAVGKRDNSDQPRDERGRWAVVANAAAAAPGYAHAALQGGLVGAAAGTLVGRTTIGRVAGAATGVVLGISAHYASRRAVDRMQEGRIRARAKREAEKMAKAGPNWRILEPMWQQPGHEDRSVRKLRSVLSDALKAARADVVAFVKSELADLGKAKDPKADERAKKIVSKIPLGKLEDAVDALADVIGKTAREVADGALVRVGLGDDESMVERVSDRAVAAARARAADLVGMRWDEDAGEFVQNPRPDMAITDSTRDTIRSLIANGLAENKSADDIAEDIENSVAFSPERADLVAKTEIARANSEAALTAYGAAREAGVRVMKKWIVAAKDVCDDCTKNAKQGPIELDEPFQNGDLTPPAHPNCRCAVSPVVYDGEDDDTTDEGRAE